MADHPPVRDGVMRSRRRSLASAACILVLAAASARGDEERLDVEGLDHPVEILRDRLGIAHIYAAVVASRAARPPKPVGAAIRDGARHASGMLVAMLIPAALLLLGSLGLVEEYTAYFLALGSGILLLALIGYANAARNGSSWPWRVAGLIATTVMGLLVIGLSILAH